MFCFHSFDEPTAGLDPNERIRFRNLVSELSEERLVLLSTHIVSDIEYIANEYLSEDVALFILFLSMLVSAKTRSKALAVTIPFMILFVLSFLGGMSVLSEILGLLPDQLLQVCTAVRTFNLYQIGTKVMGSVPLILVIYFILFCILLPVLYQLYRKTEIK